MPNPYKKQDKYHNKQLERGMERVTVWVPAEEVDALKLIAKRMRKGTYR